MAFGIDDIIATGLKILDKVIPDPAQKAEAQLKLLQLQQAGEFKELDTELAMAQGQMETNKAEAASADPFSSGWRPAIGWVCAAALFFQYIARPLIQWACILYGKPMPILPGIDDALWQLMLGMLGLGGLRTYEKSKGVTNGR